MDYEELADIYSTLDDPKKIKTLREANGAVSEERIAEDIEEPLETVSSYISDFEEVGLLEYVDPGYRITETGVSLLEPGDSEKPLSKEMIDSHLEKYWPALAYATCNNPEGSENRSIFQRRLAEETEGFTDPGPVSSLCQKAVEEGYLFQISKGDYRVTEKGGKLVPEGWETDDDLLLYDKNDWTDFVEAVEKRKIEGKEETREIFTVNDDMVVMGGGKAARIDDCRRFNEGDEVRIRETGETIGWGEFSKVEIVGPAD